MSLYWVGAFITMGFIVASENPNDYPDTWSYGFLFMFLVLVFPLYWGFFLGSMYKDYQNKSK